MSDRLNQVAGHVAPQNVTTGAGLLTDQVAIITGAGQGIGAAAAVLFAQQGAKVVVSDIDDSESPETGRYVSTNLTVQQKKPSRWSTPSMLPVPKRSLSAVT